jgi:hypothetical protein
MKLLIVPIVLIGIVFAADRKHCFDDYRTGKIDKKAMMKCANIKDTGYLPMPKDTVPEPLSISAQSTSTNLPAISSDTATDPLANIVAIKAIALMPVNTDGNADKDSLEIGIIFGDSHANQVVLPEGTVLSYTYTMNERNVMTSQNVHLLLSSNGTITKDRNNWASFVVKMPSSLKHNMYVSSEIKLVFQNGKTLYGKENTTFNLN